MRKRYLILLIAFYSFFPGCKKKQYLCWIPNCYCRPLGIAFTGFTESALDTIILLSYKGGSNFSQQLTVDTFRYDTSDFIKRGDSIFLKHDNSDYLFFYQIPGYTDYKLILPEDNLEYTITGTRRGPDADSFYSETDCMVKISNIIPLVNTHVNGKLVNPVLVDDDYPERFIFISK